MNIILDYNKEMNLSLNQNVIHLNPLMQKKHESKLDNLGYYIFFSPHLSQNHKCRGRLREMGLEPITLQPQCTVLPFKLFPNKICAFVYLLSL